MELRELGRTAVSIPEVGMGMWKYRGGPELLRTGGAKQALSLRVCL